LWLIVCMYHITIRRFLLFLSVFVLLLLLLRCIWLSPSKNIVAPLLARYSNVPCSSSSSRRRRRKRQRASNSYALALNECVPPVVGHAGKFGSQVRPVGGRCHCADRGDTGGRPAAQGCPAADNGVWQLAGAGVGEVRRQRPQRCETLNIMLRSIRTPAHRHCSQFLDAMCYGCSNSC